MAYTGYRYPKYCPITIGDDGKETLGTGKVMAKGVRMDVTVNTSDVTFYADDGLAESIKEFTDGSITMENDDLTNEVLADLTGATITEEGELTASGDDTAPYVRVGFLARKIKHGKSSYQGTVYMKVQFAIPAESYETKGQSTVFKSSTLTGSIYRNADGEWKKQKDFPTVTEAEAYIDGLLGITAAQS